MKFYFVNLRNTVPVAIVDVPDNPTNEDMMRLLENLNSVDVLADDIIVMSEEEMVEYFANKLPHLQR